MKRLLIAIGVSLLLSGNAVAAKKRKPAPVPTFSAKSYLVADSAGMVLKEQDGDTVRPIASITKLMISMLAAEQDLDEALTIPKQRKVQSSIPWKTTTLSRKELLILALVRSDNFAAQILCSNLPNCVDAMNSKAQELGMASTHFNEPTGLDVGNVSTAHDLLKLMLVASTNSTVAEISSMAKAEIETNGKAIKVRNTNPLTSKLRVTLSKTGFTNPAGGCLVMIIDSTVGQRILILLGSRNGKTRIPDMEKLVAGL
jgi:D-alanyl-D-alanine endopeptidase (penicillin-binding protein 7)